LQIEEEDIAWGAVQQWYHLIDSIGVANHLDVIVQLEQQAQSLAEESVIVGDRNSNRFSHVELH
jgi:hypothetical protein